MFLKSLGKVIKATEVIVSIDSFTPEVIKRILKKIPYFLYKLG